MGGRADTRRLPADVCIRDLSTCENAQGGSWGQPSVDTGVSMHLAERTEEAVSYSCRKGSRHFVMKARKKSNKL